MDQFQILYNLKNMFVSITFGRNSAVYNSLRNGAVIELPVVVSIKKVSSSLIGDVDC